MIFSKALIEFVHPKYVGKCQSHIAKEFNLCICPVLECYKDVGSMLFIQDFSYFFCCYCFLSNRMLLVMEMLVDQCHVSGLCAESIIKWPCAATTRSTCVSCDHVCIGHIKLIFW